MAYGYVHEISMTGIMPGQPKFSLVLKVPPTGLEPAEHRWDTKAVSPSSWANLLTKLDVPTAYYHASRDERLARESRIKEPGGHSALPGRSRSVPSGRIFIGRAPPLSIAAGRRISGNAAHPWPCRIGQAAPRSAMLDPVRRNSKAAAWRASSSFFGTTR